MRVEHSDCRRFSEPINMVYAVNSKVMCYACAEKSDAHESDVTVLGIPDGSEVRCYGCKVRMTPKAVVVDLG